MSRIGWRWWNLGKDGSLRSVNNEIWPPNEPVQAECLYLDKAKMRQIGLNPLNAKDIHTDGHVRMVSTPKGLKPEFDPVPAYGCTCGMWAYYDPEIASGLPHVSGYLQHCKVFGCVEAWGGVVEHELGFRCEWAIPRGLWIIRGHLHPAYEVQRFQRLDELVKVWDYEEGKCE